MDFEDFDPDFSSVEDYARMYRAVGLKPIPALNVQPGQQWKRPSVPWKPHQNAPVSEEQHRLWFDDYRGTNLGALTGDPTLVVDLDTQKNPKALDWWRGLLAVHNNGMEIETPTQRTGGGGLQLFFRLPKGVELQTIKTAIGVDIRCTGGFAVLPPSRHESGGQYRWLEGLGPWETPLEEAPDWLVGAINTLHAEHGGVSTGAKALSTASPETPRTIGGRLLDGREAYMTSLIWCAVLDLYEDAPILADFSAQRDAAFERYVQHVAPRLSLEQRQGLTDAEALELEGRGKTLFDAKWRIAIGYWDTKVKEAAASRKRDPRPFDVEVMDPDTGEYTTVRIGEEPQKTIAGGQDEAWPSDDAPSDPQPPVSPALAQAAVWDPWEAPPTPGFPIEVLPEAMRAYVVTAAQSIGGDPSAIAMTALATASAAIDQSFRLRMRKGGRWMQAPILWVMLFGDPSTKKTPIINGVLWPLEMVERDAREAHQKEIARWKAAGGKRGDDDEPPPPTRYITTDATVEKIADMLTRQDRGILVKKNELSGWMGAIDGTRQGKEAEKSFWANAYDGNSHSVDRVIRGETFVKNLCVPMIGGLQPAELEKLPDLTSNGLMQRFLPVVMHPAKKGADIDDSREAERWEALIRYLSSMQPHTVIPSPEAMGAFDAFQTLVDDFMSLKGMGDKFLSFVGKLSGVQGSLALILHLCGGKWDEPVSGDAARRAAKILEEFVIPHGLAFYSQQGDKAHVEETLAIASYLLSSDLDRFTARDLTRNIRAIRGEGSIGLARRLGVFVTNGWLEEERAANGLGGVKAWLMVPGVRQTLAQRRAQERARRVAIHQRVAAIYQKAAEKKAPKVFGGQVEENQRVEGEDWGD